MPADGGGLGRMNDACAAPSIDERAVFIVAFRYSIVRSAGRVKRWATAMQWKPPSCSCDLQALPPAVEQLRQVPSEVRVLRTRLELHEDQLAAVRENHELDAARVEH